MVAWYWTGVTGYVSVHKLEHCICIMQYTPPLDHVIMVPDSAAYIESLEYRSFILCLSSLLPFRPPPPGAQEKNLIPQVALLEVAYN